jgi:quaternary ammonium compound-resistance protein SugE
MSATYIPSVLAAWMFILISGLFEIVFAIQMKASDGFTKPVPSIIAVLAVLISVWVMTIGLRTLQLGPAYAVWAGIGTVGTVIAGIVLYGEPLSAMRALFIALIVVGIVGLQLQGAR